MFYCKFPNRFYQEQTTQAYGTYPVNLYQQNYYSPSTGQSPLSLSEPQTLYNPSSPGVSDYQYTTQSPYSVHYNTLPITKQVFSYNPYYSTTRNPYDFRNFQVYQYTAETKQTQYTVPSSSQSASTESTTPTSTTTRSPYFVRFSFSSTKNPYDFKEFATKRSVSKTTEKSTTEQYSSSVTESSTLSTSSTPKTKFGFFSKLDFRNYFNRTTTKNPYDFDLSNYKEIPNNNIKRSYSLGSYYGSQNRRSDNVASPNETMKAEESSRPLFISINPNSTLLAVSSDPK